jgi:hypothetical protein
MYTWNQIQDLHGSSGIQKEQDCLHYKIELKIVGKEVM